jgi:hypothetical protein
MNSCLNLKRITLILILGLFFVALALAQSNVETPESVAERYFNSSRKNDWATHAELTHSESLSKFKKMFSAEMDEYFEELGPYFFNVKSKAEFEKLSEKVVCERFFKNLTKQDDNENDIDVKEDRIQKIFGHVIEPPDTAYVIYRRSIAVGPISLNNPQILVLKKDGNNWRVHLHRSLVEGFARPLAQNRRREIERRGKTEGKETLNADPVLFPPAVATKIPSLPASANLEIDQSPEIYGFKLGMSMDTIFKRFPILRKQADSSDASSISLKFTDKIDEAKSPTENRSEHLLNRGDYIGYTNIREIILEYSNNKVTGFKIAFGDSIKWDRLDQYLYNLQRTNYLPGTWHHISGTKESAEKAALKYKEWRLEASLVKGMPEVYVKELPTPITK